MRRLIIVGVSVAGLFVTGCESKPGAVPINSLPPITTAAPSPATVTAAEQTATTLGSFYVIVDGDTLSGIAAKFDVSIDDLIAINEITDPDSITAGDQLLIPPK